MQAWTNPLQKTVFYHRRWLEEIFTNLQEPNDTEMERSSKVRACILSNTLHFQSTGQRNLEESIFCNSLINLSFHILSYYILTRNL